MLLKLLLSIVLLGSPWLFHRTYCATSQVGQASLPVPADYNTCYILPVVSEGHWAAGHSAKKFISSLTAPMPKARYAARVRDVEGTPYEVRIFAPHEKVEIDRYPGSEFLGKGAKYYTGTYQVALRREGASKHRIQRIPLFGYETAADSKGVFTPWNKRVMVLKGKADRWPDLLLITQYASSNGDNVRAFFVQNGVLVPVVWRVSSKEKVIAQFVHSGRSVKRLHGNIYQTSFYSINQDEFGFHTLTWRFELKARRMFLLHDEHK